ncbi:MAG: hypothetical protein JO301_17190 [Chitinophagaceae bacterium]|nr:hypothetical protein [Chitinophagaceae bacterium]
MERTQEPELVTHAAWLRVPAKIISYIFHPLFIPTYFFYFLIRLFPYEFPGINEWQLQLRFFSVFWLTAFFPAFAVFLLWRLKFSESIFLRTRKERIIPYVITMFFYWWMYYLSRNFGDQPAVLKFFYLGIFISTVAGLILNNYQKISLHGLALGGIWMAVILTSVYYHTSLGLLIAIVTVIAGIVCTSRLLVSDHTNTEVYSGFVVGVLCQGVAYYFVI